MNIKQLAQHLGLSITTVSRALHGYDDVSEKTRARVIEAAKEFNYYPNANAQRLKIQKTRTVGLMLSTFTSGFDNPYFTEILKGVGKELSKREYNLLISLVTSKEKEMPELLRLVKGKLVDAIILVRTQRDDPRVTYLLDNEIPFVCHGRTTESRPYPWVDTDGKSALYTITKRLIDLGHKEIIPVMPLTDYYYKFERLSGYLKAMQEAGLEVKEEKFISCIISEEASYHHTLNYLESYVPSAFVCFSDIMAYGVVKALKEKQLTVGKSVSVTGYDSLTFSSYFEPILTTIGYDLKKSAEVMVDYLFKSIEGFPVDHLNHICEYELIIGDSDGPITNN